MKQDDELKDHGFHICAIGSSAGGLEAITAMLNPLKSDIPIAYIVAQHLSPSHSSVLSDLLGRETELEVKTIEDGQDIEPGVVHITPPNFNVTVSGQKLALTKPSEAVGPKPSVDILLHSLAAEYSDKAIAVILSGTGSDGAKGVMAVKAAGGLVIVQDPARAKYDGMPKAAITSGAVDRIVDAGEIGKTLRNLYALEPQQTSGKNQLPYKSIAKTLRDYNGLDISRYKSSTIERRMHRRMSLFSFTSYEDYNDYLKTDPEELNLLSRDLLISVTAFFRDDHAFKALEKVLYDKLDRFMEGQFRIWVPACASGEEAYSIAILVEEYNRKAERIIPYQIFATDMDSLGTARGRRGEYAYTAISKLPETIKNRYFSPREDNVWEVSKALRENVVFAEHNLIENPPFSRLDLISCRNLLIYFMADLQKKVFQIFHYSLRDGGLLFLGKSENTQQAPKFFHVVQKQARIFEKNSELPPVIQSSKTRKINTEAKNSKSGIASLGNANEPLAFYEPFLPALVRIDGQDAIKFVSEKGRKYLQIPTGQFGAGFFELIAPELRADLRAVIHKARRTGEVTQSLFHSYGEQSEVISIASYPDEHSHDITITFSIRDISSTKSTDSDDVDLVNELEHELSTTREHLQTVVEELETSNEELQSVNEELQSSNEELQSTNEELQTTNEELQSTNEELLTVNDELHVKSVELETALYDLENIQSSVDAPILLIDDNLEITRYTGPLSGIVETNTITLGQNLFASVWSFDIQDYYDDIKRALKAATHSEHRLKINSIDYLLKIAPYFVKREEVAGVVLSFVDVTQLNKAMREVEHSETMLKQILHSQLDAVCLLDTHYSIEFKNTVASRIFEAGNEFNDWSRSFCEESIATISIALERLVKSNQSQSFEIKRASENGFSHYQCKISPIVFVGDKEKKLVFSMHDVTDLVISTQRLKNESHLALTTINAIDDGIITCDALGRIKLVNNKAASQLNIEASTIAGKAISSLMCIQDSDGQDCIELILSGQSQGITVHNQHIVIRGKRSILCDVALMPITGFEEQDVKLIILMKDSLARENAVKQLHFVANHDALTGLYNRSYFDTVLAQHIMLRSDKEKDQSLALLYLDLDQFKIVNDTAGHHAGDNMLKQVGTVLKNLTPPSDILARLGGDEFGIITSLDNVEKKAQKIIDTIEEFRFICDEKVFRIGVSIGIVSLKPMYRDAITALSLADAACYEAKERGRNCFYTHQDDTAQTERPSSEMTTAAYLREALDNEELVVFAQDMVAAKSWSRKGEQKHYFEILSRLERNGKTIPPAHFIPAAERYGLISKIDEYVLRKVLLKSGLKDYPIPFQVHINVSALSIGRDDFVSNVFDIIEKSGITPSNIVLELTETAAINHVAEIARALELIKERGVLIALDDFGSGMSSFGLLKHLPIDIVKIDGAFVKNLTDDYVDYVVVEAIVKVAHEMGIKTVAEYAETAETVGALKALGVDLIQGYYFSKPKPLPEILQTNDEPSPST